MIVFHDEDSNELQLMEEGPYVYATIRNVDGQGNTEIHLHEDAIPELVDWLLAYRKRFKNKL